MGDDQQNAGAGRGQWMALAAALLGWMFDGLEQGLFPLVNRPALGELLNVTDDKEVARWFGVATACFLVGAATGGVLFGWLGDRIGRVRAMTLSVLMYSIFSGLCGLSQTAGQIAILRFFSALGMGGEWSLGVALVMEVWPDRSRALLAGLIGASANVGFLLVALLGVVVGKELDSIGEMLLGLGVPQPWVNSLVGHSGWRLVMLLGATPALLTFFIRLFVPESERWEKEQLRGKTSNWAARDLLGVLLAAGGGIAIIYLWAKDFALPVRLLGTVLLLLVVTGGYLYPVVRYLQRSEATSGAAAVWLPTVRRMLLGAGLAGVPLLVTWAAMQWATNWADQLTGGKEPAAKAYTQCCSAFGAILGTVAGALLAGRFGRRRAYTLLCLGALGSAFFFFQGNSRFGGRFLFAVFLAGGFSASFYGWLPLYLPELFSTRVRAVGQGFSYNFGRILAAVGTLQMGSLVGLFGNDYPRAGSVIVCMYVLGLALIWLAPETHGQPLRDA